MNNCFCTLFDHRYLERGVALYESIDCHCDVFQLWVLCLDDTCFEVLESMKLKNLRLVKLADLEEEDLALKDVKQHRTPVEYYFTCKPSLVLYVFNHCEPAIQVSYMDADIYFFSSPELIYEGMVGKSVAITPHRFDHGMKHLEEYGKFNAGWLLFKRNEKGLACLRWWRERCIEWCHDFPEADRFADQKYIDQFPVLFDGIWSVDDVGVNLAPWNVAGKTVSMHDDNVYVDGKRLIFYHFHNLRNITPSIFDLGCEVYTPILSKVIRKYIYKPYLRIMLQKQAELKSDYIPLQRGKNKNSDKPSSHPPGFVSRCRHIINFTVKVGKGLLKGKYMVARNI